MVINPVAYAVLIGLDGAAFLWSWALLAKGVPVALGLKPVRGGIVATVVMGLVGAGAFALRLV